MPKRHQSLIPLSHQHHHGLVMSRRLRRHPTDDADWSPATLALAHELIDFFRHELAPHFAAEEEALFPAMEQQMGSLFIIDQLRREHQQMAAIIERLGQPTTAASVALLGRFGELLHEHIRKEERILFALFEERMPDESAGRVGRQIAEMMASFRPRVCATRPRRALTGGGEKS